MGTISEEILGQGSGKKTSAGEFVIARVDYAMSHDGTSVLAVKSFKEMGVEKVWDPDRIIIPFDHLVPANNEKTALLHKELRAMGCGPAHITFIRRRRRHLPPAASPRKASRCRAS